MLIVSLVHLSGCKDEDEKPEKNLNCIPENLREHVVALYPFPDGSVNDFTGNRKKLTIVGDLKKTEDRFGNPNNAYALDNLPAENNMYLTLADPSYLNDLKEFTISLWYAPSDPTREGGVYEGPIHRGENLSCSGSGSWSIALYDCRRTVFGASSTLWDAMMTGNCDMEVTLRTGVWHHVVASYNVETKRMDLYTDGVLEGSTTDTDCRNPQEEIGALFLGKGYT